MARALNTWRAWSARRRLAVGAGALALLAAAAVGAYLIRKRPGDVSNPGAEFRAVEKKKKERTVDWPLYGYDLERTRYLPVKGLEPPFQRIWGHEAGTLLEFSPIVVDGTLYAVDNDAVAFALDADTGKLRWKRRVGQLNASSPTYSHRRLYVVNLEPAQVLALNAKNGKTAWSRDLPERSESTPLVYRGRVYFGAHSGDVFAFDAKTGKTVWQTTTEGEVKGGPAFQNGTVYVGNYAGKMYALRASDGEVRWEASDLGVAFGRSGRFYSTPALAFGRVYAGDADGRVYSFEATTGEIAWTHSTGGAVYSAPAVADAPGPTRPAVYIGSADGSAYALDAKTGEEIWSAPVGGLISGAGSVIGDVFYLADVQTGKTVGLDIDTGRRVFRFEKGEYNPVISDGQRIYLTGYSSITALEPKERKRGRGDKGKGGDRARGGGGKENRGSEKRG
jgi:outer membrane protein assembly factor BamB